MPEDTPTSLLTDLLFGSAPPPPEAVRPPPDGEEARRHEQLVRQVLELIGERLLALRSSDQAGGQPSGRGSGLGINPGAPPPWYAGGPRGLDAARAYVRAAADALQIAGDPEAAEAVRVAIAPKRGRGRPAQWRPSDVLSLWMDVTDIARRHPAMSGRSIFAALRGRPEWEAFDAEELRGKFREGASKLGLSQGNAIAALRKLGG
jgi:hypothetical protein